VGGKAKRQTRKARAVASAVDISTLGVPICRVRRDGEPLRVILTTQGLLAAGALFQVVPVVGPVPPVPEEQWQMTIGSSGVDDHVMKTDAKHLEGDGLNFQINLCALSQQFVNGAVDVTVEQDGVQRPIVPPMHFPLKNVPPCQSAPDKLTPTTVVSGFAFLPE
jgi:hypothetical protein